MDGALTYEDLQMNGLVYTQSGQNIRSFFPPWMGWPECLDQYNQLIYLHSIILTGKMGSVFFLFS